MGNLQLLEYIQSQLGQNIPRADIEHSLVAVGWEPSHVAEAFAFLTPPVALAEGSAPIPSAPPDRGTTSAASPVRTSSPRIAKLSRGALAIECLGTFGLVLVIGLTGNPLAIGAVLTAMVYMGGYISGAHYNPAVTLAVLLRGGTIDAKSAALYGLAQVGGAFAAAVSVLLVQGTAFVPQPGPGSTFLTATFLELVSTFLLATVVLHVATSAKTRGNQYFGFAIGLTVMALAFAAGPISGGVFNPAVALGAVLVDLKNFSDHAFNLFMYFLGPLSGGMLASLVYRLLSADSSENETRISP